MAETTSLATNSTLTAGAPIHAARSRHLGLALAVIATAQLMVTLDASIVNVALPKIQLALGFSGSGLEWVVNAYTLVFGGLLLLGGRAGDLLGRRKVFIAGVLIFAGASLLGGLAPDQTWLLLARAIQGVGAAMAAPTALALIAVTFPEGPPRNRAMGVYAAVSVAGVAIGLIAGGLLVTSLNWRWVFFVNVPIGIVLAFAAAALLPESERIRGHFDLGGAITATLGISALVYGLTKAATTQDGVSHWTDTNVVLSLVGAIVLLASFVVIELRSQHPLLPFRILRHRARTGAYLVSLCMGTAMFGMFFFLTIFIHSVWGYSALKTGVSYLPIVAMIMVGSGIASQAMGRVGARPLMIFGSVTAAAGLFWLSLLNAHSSYVGGMLGPMMLIASGLGFLFVPGTLVALTDIDEHDAGVASSLLNVGQQVGGAIGLALLGTVAWSTVANHSHGGAAAGGHPSASALAAGFSAGFRVSSIVMMIALVLTLALIRVKPMRGDTNEAVVPGVDIAMAALAE
jgi:EmrB/QacA subfamily drug resistance transporter